ncbi:MAG: RNA polymerase sigma factor, partial [Patescibacteria group bacterium]
EYVEKIRRFILFKISQKEVAEELTNSVFIKTLNYLLEGQEIENFRAFLYQTARRLVIDFYRTKSYEVPLDEALKISVDKDINKIIDQKLEIEKIKKYLSILKPEHQEIVILRFFEGLPFKEIAKIVGQSEENVRTIASRSIKKLKEYLKNL